MQNRFYCDVIMRRNIRFSGSRACENHIKSPKIPYGTPKISLESSRRDLSSGIFRFPRGFSLAQQSRIQSERFRWPQDGCHACACFAAKNCAWKSSLKIFLLRRVVKAVKTYKMSQTKSRMVGVSRSKVENEFSVAGCLTYRFSRQRSKSFGPG